MPESDGPAAQATPAGSEFSEEGVLEEIQQRVLWLATRIIDVANRERTNEDGIKVGGHQASSASLVSVMTALWFHHLGPDDLVSVKPHASPVLHAINYLMGHLDRSYLTTLRGFNGLQAYPSRTKDPDRVDFSTGSVGLGAVAPLFAAVTRRYVDSHFGGRPPSRFISLLGDAELDEGNVWEAIADPVTRGLGSVMWVVDFNRQSLDRVVPGVRIEQWKAQFRAAGWHVSEVKYGSRMLDAFARPDGNAVRGWIDRMSNQQYQSLFALEQDELRQRLLDGAPPQVHRFFEAMDARDIKSLITNLGGHDLKQLLAAFAECDAVTDRPSVVFAYTVKGWGLPFAGNPRNHSSLLSEADIDAMRTHVGLRKDADGSEWDRLPEDSAAGRFAAARGRYMARRERSVSRRLPEAPAEVKVVRGSRPISSQEAFGRVVTALSRVDGLGKHMVTTAPDVATTTNLAGFINRVGVFSPQAQPRWSDDHIAEWDEGPSGQHLELGISEMNFFLLLGQLGLGWDLSDQPLLPIGTVYDPFVLRGLDAFVYSAYSGSRFVVAGTPSGVTLAPEGGAHQSSVTASVGLELPGVVSLEPAFAQAVDWLLCDAIGRIAADPAGTSAGERNGADGEAAYYFRLSTRPVDQRPFAAARDRIGSVGLRQQVIAGAYRVVDASNLAKTGAPTVNLAVSGAVVLEALEAAAILADEGVAAHVVDITSASRLYTAWRRSIRTAVRTATVRSLPDSLHGPFAAGAPIVSLHDASSHALAWLGSALGVPAVSLGVDQFGQSGTIQDLYAAHNLGSGSIVNAALAVLAE